MSDSYVLTDGMPNAETYVRLRTAAGLSPFSLKGASIGMSLTVA